MVTLTGTVDSDCPNDLVLQHSPSHGHRRGSAHRRWSWFSAPTSRAVARCSDTFHLGPSNRMRPREVARMACRGGASGRAVATRRRRALIFAGPGRALSEALLPTVRATARPRRRGITGIWWFGGCPVWKRCERRVSPLQGLAYPGGVGSRSDPARRGVSYSPYRSDRTR